MNNKPDSPVCDKCFVMHNTLRCMCCKHKTEEWMKKNIGSRAVIMLGDSDLYKPRAESEVQDADSN